MPLAHLGNKKYYLGMFFKVTTMVMMRMLLIRGKL